MARLPVIDPPWVAGVVRLTDGRGVRRAAQRRRDEPHSDAGRVRIVSGALTSWCSPLATFFQFAWDLIKRRARVTGSGPGGGGCRAISRTRLILRFRRRRAGRFPRTPSALVGGRAPSPCQPGSA